MIGVTGATGEIGARLVRRLTERGAPHRLIVRDAGRAPTGPGEVVDFGGHGDPAGMRRAFDGVSTLFLCSAHEAQDRVEQHRSAVDAASRPALRASSTCPSLAQPETRRSHLHETTS